MGLINSRKILKLTFLINLFLWLFLGFNYSVSSNPILLIIHLFNYLVIYVNGWLIINQTLKNWLYYLLLYVFSLVISLFIVYFGSIFIIGENLISDEYLLKISYIFSVAIPIVIILVESKEIKLREMKLAIYAGIAVITTFSSFLFYIEDTTVELIYKYGIKNEIITVNISESDLPRLEKEIEEIEKNNEIHEIKFKDRNGNYFPIIEIKN